MSNPDDPPRSPPRDVLGHHLARLPRWTLAIGLTLLPIVALINVAVLVWSFGTVDLAERIVAPHLLVFAALLVFVPMLANAMRLTLWSRFLRLQLGFAGALRTLTGTMLANSVTPSATGSIPIKVLLLVGEGVPARRAVSLISFQAAEDALVMFSLVGLGIAISGFAMFDFLSSDSNLYTGLDRNLRIAAAIGLGLAGSLAVIGYLIAAGVFGHRVQASSARGARRIRAATSLIVDDWKALARSGKRVAVVSLCLAVLQWTVRFSIAGLVLAAFGIAWQPALFWLLQYLVQAISATVPSPGGAGGAEAGFLLVFGPFVDRAVLFPAMSAWRLLFFYLPLAGAAVIFFVLRRQHRYGFIRCTDTSPPAAAPLHAE